MTIDSYKTMTLKKLILALAGLMAGTAQAAIPHSHTIAARVARGHGRNAYVIEQEVQFRTSAEPLVLRENWIVEHGDRMRLTVTPAQTGAKGSDAARLEALYLDGKRWITDPTANGIRAGAVGAEFIESAFHARTAKGFLASLVRSRIVPASFMHDRPRITKLEQIKYQPEPLVRLGRDSGVVAWIFGEPSPAEGKPNPQAWIEQDSFVLRRLRFPSEAEVVADRISSFPNNLKFPRERTVTWGDNIVTIRVVSIRSISLNKNHAMDVKTFTAGAKHARLPDLAQVREFYSRFR